MNLLRSVLKRTRERFSSEEKSTGEALADPVDSLEESLILSDAGTQATQVLMDAVRRRLSRRQRENAETVRQVFTE